jgi:hypothetical protein
MAQAALSPVVKHFLCSCVHAELSCVLCIRCAVLSAGSRPVASFVLQALVNGPRLQGRLSRCASNRASSQEIEALSDPGQVLS